MHSFSQFAALTTSRKAKPGRGQRRSPKAEGFKSGFAKQNLPKSCSQLFKAEGKAQKVLSAGGFAKDVLASKVAEGSADGYTREQNINGEKVTLTLVKIK